ncbi:MAG: hypothetical protein ACD_20C00191G0017 [uncultured bacterium]|nr:MAG: hypothetical protein ACD_20C00191G0017 [uncultured bacterium]
MLQEATRILSSAFTDSFVKRLCLYLHDCVREEVKSSTFRNLNQDKDNKWMFVEGEETLLTNPESFLSFDGASNQVTELMIQADISQKDHYLIYGHLFLTGKNTKRKRGEEFLTPLLYTPCKLERNGITINCTLTDETLSLNTASLAELLKFDDEDRVEHLLEGLIDVVPELPLTNEGIQVFLTTLKSIIPEINIDQIASDKLNVSHQSAIILTKRPTVTAGLLHELTQMSEMPVGVYRETSLSIIQEEFSKSKKGKSQSGLIFDNKKNKKDQPFYPITPLALSDSQCQVLEATKEYPIVSVCGPPGTGKSQTIVNLVSHLIASGKTVLVASRMDKAVDVVSERLNSLGAPFLCLRAGRANYQKQLNFLLQDLLANKVDLDSGYELSILSNPDDMKALYKTKSDFENKCEKILELESVWHQALLEYKKHIENPDSEGLIKAELTKSEIENHRSLLNNLEKSLEKAGLINSLLTKYSFSQLRKKLSLNEAEPSLRTIDQLRLNLLTKELALNLKTVESSISKIGNLHQLLDNLKDLRQKQRTLAKDILKNQRRESLKSLIRDQFKRQTLYIHSKALVERKKNLQNRLLQDEDFRPLLEAFPCWAITTYAISESLPLKPGMFDVAIIDEASQCDIASCFPVLFRAKSAVIVGDDKQLSHMSFLEKAKEQSFLSKYDIPDRYQIMWRFRTNSIFDLANFYSTNPILLDEHFRSRPPIINFSNQEFYGNRIRIMNRELTPSDCIELQVVKDAKVDLDSTRNMAEAEKIMEKLQDIMANDKNTGKAPCSIGIISPFRGQVELIKKAISQVISDELVKRHQIEVGTAHTFQGDEKDIILLSFTLAQNSHHQSLTFVQKPNLFNVAITRAKKQLICFISREPESLPPGLLRSYIEYIRVTNQQLNDTKTESVQENYNNSMEEEIAQLCKEEGLTVIPNFESAGFKIDLVVSDEISSLAIECNGYNESVSLNSSVFKQENYSKEIWKQSILERCGWKVLRITAREWSYSQKACINRIKDALISHNS